MEEVAKNRYYTGGRVWFREPIDSPDDVQIRKTASDAGMLLFRFYIGRLLHHRFLSARSERIIQPFFTPDTNWKFQFINHRYEHHYFQGIGQAPLHLLVELSPLEFDPWVKTCD
ncbi:MAG: hypothetical protein O3B82_00655 [Bacteroidetes bacterium]|nr:hypothetical protein [Bacteroidota bacterium]